jgi:threonine/homoserine/homoserine lactone efflux protein
VTSEFLVTTLIIVATPGIGVLFTVNAGLSRGRRAGLIAAIGCTLGIIPHMFAAVLGIAGLMQASPMLFQALKIVGVGYVLYLAWTTWRDEGALAVMEDATPRSARKVVASAILVNLLNPKLTLFFFAFLPPFVSGPNALVSMLDLSGIFMLVTLAVFAGYGIFAAALRDRIIARPNVLGSLRKAFAIAFVALAARLAVAER